MSVEGVLPGVQLLGCDGCDGGMTRDGIGACWVSWGKSSPGIQDSGLRVREYEVAAGGRTESPGWRKVPACVPSRQEQTGGGGTSTPPSVASAPAGTARTVGRNGGRTSTKPARQAQPKPRSCKDECRSSGVGADECALRVAAAALQLAGLSERRILFTEVMPHNAENLEPSLAGGQFQNPRAGNAILCCRVLEVGGPAPLESELLPSSARDGGAEQARAPQRDAQHGEISRLVVRSFQGADCCTCGQPPRRIGGNSSTPNVPMRPVSE